jgi:hypothetical protein
MGKIFYITVPLVLAGCSTHYMSPQELVNEFKVGQDSIEVFKTDQIGLYKIKNVRGEFVVSGNQFNDAVLEKINKNGRITLYGLKHGQKINVSNKNGERVKIKVDHNSQFIINKVAGKKFQTYLVGTYLAEDLIYGYRSRILGTLRTIAVDSVKSVEVYSEFKSEEK